MIFIFGGRCQGKLAFAKETFGAGLSVCNLTNDSIEVAFRHDIIVNLESGIKELLERDIEPTAYFSEHIDLLAGKIVIGNEIGCGIVPVDGFERLWRDETGWVYQFLGRNASAVYRVWAGIGTKV